VTLLFCRKAKYGILISKESIHLVHIFATGSVNNCVQQKRLKIEGPVVNSMFDLLTVKVKTLKNMKRTLQTKHIVQEMSQLAFTEITG